MEMRTRSKEELDHINASWFVDAEGVIRWKRQPKGCSRIGDSVGVTVQKTGHKCVYLHFCGKLRGHTYGKVCWFLYTGQWPDCEIDHIDRNPANNTLANLRLANRRQNQCNRIVKNKHGHQGIFIRNSGRYSAQVWLNGKALNVGTFDTAEQAAAARAIAAKQLHGDFAATH